MNFVRLGSHRFDHRGLDHVDGDVRGQFLGQCQCHRGQPSLGDEVGEIVLVGPLGGPVAVDLAHGEHGRSRSEREVAGYGNLRQRRRSLYLKLRAEIT